MTRVGYQAKSAVCGVLSDIQSHARHLLTGCRTRDNYRSAGVCLVRDRSLLSASIACSKWQFTYNLMHYSNQTDGSRFSCLS